jgi:HSP20 family protein
MALPTRWNPFREASMLDPFTNMDELFRSLGSRQLSRNMLSRGMEKSLEMTMDVHEDDTSYRVTVDVPGVKKENIDVSVEGNQVTISAEVKREKNRENEKEVHSERFEGSAYRAFTLPSEVDSSKAEARYDGGVLTLVLPKKTGSQSRHLTVN